MVVELPEPGTPRRKPDRPATRPGSAPGSAPHRMLCPVCGTTLLMSERQGIEIDYCPSCRGVWLDRGELDKIIERSLAELAPAAAQPSPDPAPARAYRADDDHEDDARAYRRHRHHHGHYRKRHKRKHWLDELFDVFD